MRDEDQAFTEIVQNEFDSQWQPAPPPPEPEVAPPPPQPDFHLNLYDDDESYRQVTAEGRSLSVQTRWGIGLIAAGLLIVIARALPFALPGWVGWLAVVLFVAGVALSLWHLTGRSPLNDEDGEV